MKRSQSKARQDNKYLVAILVILGLCFLLIDWLSFQVCVCVCMCVCVCVCVCVGGGGGFV